MPGLHHTSRWRAIYGPWALDTHDPVHPYRCAEGPH